jgi:AMIN domain
VFSVRARCFAAVLAALVAVSTVAAAQDIASPNSPVADVQSVMVVPGDNGPVLQIVSSRPLTPSLQTVQAPLRLVIDLPGAKLTTARKHIPFRDEQIKGIRIDQYQSDPPVVRIVVDLAGPVLYTWDAMGNRLRIRLHADHSATAKPDSVPAFTAGVQPAAVPVGSSGTLVEAGSRVASGASITATEETAILRLTRGGEVRVCPGTTVSVATSANGKDMMLGMSQGAMETHYRLLESSDSVLTPDFRIVLPGPGEFDLSISADAHGNTCVSAMPGNTSSVVVAELIGSGTYEVKPDQQIVFRQGSLETVESPVASCGCPARQEPVLRTSTENAPAVPEEKAGSKLQVSNSSSSDIPSKTVGNGSGAATAAVDAAPEAKPLPPAKPGDKNLQIEAPLVFNASELAKAQPPAAPVAEAAALPRPATPATPMPAAVVLPPAADPKPAHKGFFGRLKGFFSSIF